SGVGQRDPGGGSGPPGARPHGPSGGGGCHRRADRGRHTGLSSALLSRRGGPGPPIDPPAGRPAGAPARLPSGRLGARIRLARGMASLAPERAEAVRLALSSRLAVLTGGPGTGKSTTTRAIVTLARAKGAQVLLAAPTGRAARRLSEITGQPATTLHRLLE